MPSDDVVLECEGCGGQWDALEDWNDDADAIIRAYEQRTGYCERIIALAINTKMHGASILKRAPARRVIANCPACKIEHTAQEYRDVGLDPTAPQSGDS